jgi:DNA-binding NarL/FixJ family response regulator
MAMAIRILIVDDSALFRQGVRDTLERNPDWEVCGEATDGLQAIEGNRRLMPHLIVMDFSMPAMTGLEAACEILKEFPELPILLLTLYLTRQLAEQARNAGVRGTLSKTSMHRLRDGIESLLRGEDFTCPDSRAETRGLSQRSHDCS